jgi:hypothetical protein
MIHEISACTDLCLGLGLGLGLGLRLGLRLGLGLGSRLHKGFRDCTLVSLVQTLGLCIVLYTGGETIS